jgi:dTDP-4-amino-4,6-dideoxygalactose transaminase
MSAFLPFSKPSLDEHEINEIIDSINSGWITTGPKVQKFEQTIAKYLQAPNALALSSGTAGLHLALLSLNLKPTDEVIVPAMTFVASANTIEIAGGKPVFVDVDIHTFNMRPEDVEQAITKNTRAIMPVHFAGLPVDMDAIYTIAKQYNLRVIEDAAHAIGTEYKGRKIGSFGDTQVFSFHPNKNMTTGEGGCVTTSDAQLVKDVSVTRFHGIDRNAWNRFTKEGSQVYDVVKVGFKYNMMDIQAAIGLHQLAKLDEFIAKRTKLAKRYTEQMADWPALTLPQPANYTHKHAWHLFTPLINEKSAGITRNNFMEAMKEYNIGTGFHYGAVHLFTYYKDKYGYNEGSFPNAEAIGKRVVSLPLFPDLTFDDQDRVINAMKQIFNK